MTPVFTSFRDAELDLEALAATAHRLLRQARLRVDDGRVAGAPDARSIRYYQTMGLIDRPLRYEGRRAIYGYRHLVQLLAIRQLQREGYPLAIIQATLPAKATTELEAALGQVFGADPPGDIAGSTPTTVPPPLPDAPAAPQAPRLTPLSPPHRVLTGEVAPGVTVSIDPSRVAGADDVYLRIAQYVAQIMQED